MKPPEKAIRFLKTLQRSKTGRYRGLYLLDDTPCRCTTRLVPRPHNATIRELSEFNSYSYSLGLKFISCTLFGKTFDVVFCAACHTSGFFKYAMEVIAKKSKLRITCTNPWTKHHREFELGLSSRFDLMHPFYSAPALVYGGTVIGNWYCLEELSFYYRSISVGKRMRCSVCNRIATKKVNALAHTNRSTAQIRRKSARSSEAVEIGFACDDEHEYALRARYTLEDETILQLQELLLEATDTVREERRNQRRRENASHRQNIAQVARHC